MGGPLGPWSGGTGRAPRRLCLAPLQGPRTGVIVTAWCQAFIVRQGQGAYRMERRQMAKKATRKRKLMASRSRARGLPPGSAIHVEAKGDSAGRGPTRRSWRRWRPLPSEWSFTSGAGSGYDGVFASPPRGPVRASARRYACIVSGGIVYFLQWIADWRLVRLIGLEVLMISQVSGSGGGDVWGYGLVPQALRDPADMRRMKLPSETLPNGQVPDDQGSEANMAGTDRIAGAVASSLINRVYDAAGLSHSLSQEQGIQAGEIDTRR